MSAPLSAYLERIDSPVAPDAPADLDTLRRVVFAHATTIPFENLNPFTGREVLLDRAALTTKIVEGGRGGYCFEMNLLLRGALDDLGFRTTCLAARVMWNRPADAPMPPRSHMLVRVDLDSGPHLVDVGFGGTTLTGVLALEPDVVQETPHEPFRLRPDGGDTFVMQTRIGDEWRSMYRFDLVEQYLSDYEVSSWYLVHNPASHFVTGLMLARADIDRRFALSGRVLTTHHLGGSSDRTELASPSAVRAVLEKEFRLDTSGLPDLEDHLARLF